MENSKSKKFDLKSRTFETRVTFIRDIFTNKYSPTDIMAHCIQHKLGRSYENYVNELTKSAWRLYGEDPIKILKKIDN